MAHVNESVHMSVCMCEYLYMARMHICGAAVETSCDAGMQGKN